MCKVILEPSMVIVFSHYCSLEITSRDFFLGLMIANLHISAFFLYFTMTWLCYPALIPNCELCYADWKSKYLPLAIKQRRSLFTHFRGWSQKSNDILSLSYLNGCCNYHAAGWYWNARIRSLKYKQMCPFCNDIHEFLNFGTVLHQLISINAVKILKNENISRYKNMKYIRQCTDDLTDAGEKWYWLIWVSLSWLLIGFGCIVEEPYVWMLQVMKYEHLLNWENKCF